MKRIVIIKLGAMGDVLRTTCILKPLQEQYPSVEIEWVTQPNATPLLSNNPFLNAIYTTDQPATISTTADWVICLDEEKKALEIAQKINTKRYTGVLEKNGQVSYTDDAAEWFDMGLISRFGKEKADELKRTNLKSYPQMLFAMLGLTEKDETIYPPMWYLPKEDQQWAKEWLHQQGRQWNQPLIGINTGAGGRWQDKKLSVDETVELINQLHQSTRAQLLLLGGPEEKERNEEIKSKVKVSLIVADTSTTLTQCGALVEQCDLVITSDSLVLHMANAFSKKVVCFFYPTSAAEILLYAQGKKIIAKGKSYCSYEPVCQEPPTWNIQEIAQSATQLLLR